jgi:hypothetical protein
MVIVSSTARKTTQPAPGDGEGQEKEAQPDFRLVHDDLPERAGITQLRIPLCEKCQNHTTGKPDEPSRLSVPVSARDGADRTRFSWAKANANHHSVNGV